MYLLRLMLVGVWLGLLWVLFYFFDHYIQVQYIVSSLPGEWPLVLHVCCVVAVVRCGVLCCWWCCHNHPHVRGGGTVRTLGN